ncbi:hypothetical protein KDE13_09015 [Campylobacter sp. faydin G-140]|uniref:hypothetical protein n=1 Tax=Campylobacter anatolicus TaxID=2829105 RepID=UPI001B8E95E9|nr:hypothetical protein [Campylobacter anatolicus]MBR8466473.1 hypothetical protein [Campylobacter anatolicus]
MNAPILVLLILAGMALYFGYQTEKAQNFINKTLFLKIIAPFQGLLNTFYSNKGLIIDDIGDDYVRLNTMYKILYGVKLEGYSNTPNFLDDNDVKGIYRTYKNQPNAFFYYVIFKDGIYHRQYIFSYNKNLLKTIADKFNIGLMSGREIANTILDLYLQNNFYIKDKDIHRNIYLNFDNEFEANSQMFHKVTKENMYQNLNNIDLYQSYKTIEGVQKTDIPKILQMDFKGVVWTFFDLEQRQVENHLSRLINTAKWTGNKSGFIELKEAYDTGNIDLVVANSTAHFKEIDESIIGNFGTALKVDFLKKDIFKKNTLQKTPLKFRDTEFDYLAPLSFMGNYISCVQKARTRNADFWGFDKNGGFINYSFANENDNPHSFIIANTGAGKSFTMQKILTTMLDVDFSNAFAKNLGKDKVLVRYYDIGFSNENLLNFLKQNTNNNIAHIESEFSNFNYNICNLDDTNSEAFESDLVFVCDLINIILQSQEGSEPLNISEVTAFRQILTRIYKRKEFQDYRVSQIENLNLREKVLQLDGVNRNTYVKTLPEEYNFLKKPKLEDVIKVSKVEEESHQNSEKERLVYSGLTQKLENVKNLKYFSGFDNEDTINADFLSMDLNNYKENSLFTPIFVAIFQRTYLKDRAYAIECKRAKKPISKKLYIMEESANFFRIPYFSVLLEKLALEARKYGMHLILIAQQLEHIPSKILKVVDTRIFLLTPEKKNDLISEVIKYFEPSQNVIDSLNNTERYELCIWYLKGVFNLKLQVSDIEKELFTTNPNDINKLFNLEQKNG